MTTTTLGRRIGRLEEAARPSGTRPRCGVCGLEHAREVTIDEVRHLVRYIGEDEMPLPAPGTIRPGPFCLCACCVEYRGLSELTHGPWSVPDDAA
jgi:hypothetical protein